MPTENRSSNTEQMVSVPRDEVERLVKLLKYQAHPYTSPHAEFWQGLLDAPAAQHKGDPDRALKDALFACLAAGGDDREYGGVATSGDRQGWVRFTTVAAGAQHQGEPVALPARKDPTQHWAAPGGVHKAEGWNACLDEMAKLGPLYTHPAPVQQGEPVGYRWKQIGGSEWCYGAELPAIIIGTWQELCTHGDAGEVERLRASEKSLAKDLAESLKQQCADMRTINTLHADLESVKSSRDAFAQNAIDLRAELAERDALLRRALNGGDDSLGLDIDAALSASAEPSEREAQALKDESRLGIERLPAKPITPDGLEGVEDLARRIAERVKARAALDRKS